MTWTNITNAQLAIGAPIRSVDLLALRDNFAALAAGESGAPAMTGITNLNVIGSVCWAFNQTTSPIMTNATISGANIRYVSGYSGTNMGVLYLEGNQFSRNITFDGITSGGSRVGNTGFITTPNTTALSGTWRAMGACKQSYASYDPDDNSTNFQWGGGLFVRIA